MNNPSPPVDLDHTDRALIGELIADGRASYAALAPKVGLSQAAVRARVQRLLDQKLITVTARINPHTIGMGAFALALLGIDDPARDVAKRLEKMDEAVFVACTTGRWGILVELRCRDNNHLLSSFDRLRIEPGVSEVEGLTIMEYFKQDWEGLAEEIMHRKAPRHAPTPVKASWNIDEIDRKLISLLIEDGRSTYADLAPLVGLSQAAVRARVQRLLEEQVVVIQTYASAQALGIGAFAACLVTVKSDTPSVVQSLCAMPEITLIAATSGRYDLAIELWCRDNNHLLDSVDRIRALDRVGIVAPHMMLDVVKEEYRINTG
jgi:DNA-binding Lrp family transcriptional regulator